MASTYILPVQRHSFTFFSVLTSAPYFRLCYKASFKHIAAAKNRGWPNYFGDLRKRYPANNNGPFAVGVCWQRHLIMYMVSIPCEF